jgi:starch synthase
MSYFKFILSFFLFYPYFSIQTQFKLNSKVEILHVSAECYPMAKAGGLADVVGALPKYQNKIGHLAKVVMPMHRTAFLHKSAWEVVHKGSIHPAGMFIEYTIIKEKNNVLGFDLYCVDIFGMLDREKIYGYDDDSERFIYFQYAVADWMHHWQHKPDVVHVHDYHAGLLPFFMRNTIPYKSLSQIKTVLTIHNAQYQGWMDWSKAALFPEWDKWKAGLLDWSDQINPLAAAIKCADKVNTVSPTYMRELINEANGLDKLFQYEIGKCSGILNGIDFQVWDPALDTFIFSNFNSENADEGKMLNKQKLCKDFGFNPELPLFIFIGRLVGEKAADLLPYAINNAFEQYGHRFNFLVLGNGERAVEHQLYSIQSRWFGFYHTRFEYNEQLSHLMYSGADFLIMPSRVEPCGLNQMYALRYGTLPVVRRTGGLNDTIVDYEDWEGYGICFNHASVDDIVYSMGRALQLYQQTDKLSFLRKKMMTINNSWERSAGDYIDLYNSIYR